MLTEIMCSKDKDEKMEVEGNQEQLIWVMGDG